MSVLYSAFGSAFATAFRNVVYSALLTSVDLMSNRASTGTSVQASPIPSPSVSVWVGFATVGQLSKQSPTPSASASAQVKIRAMRKPRVLASWVGPVLLVVADESALELSLQPPPRYTRLLPESVSVHSAT